MEKSKILRVRRSYEAIQSSIFFDSDKIGNGDQLASQEIELIESRLCTVHEADTHCPHAIRLFNTNHAVNVYNKKILDGAIEKYNSTATDVYIGCTSTEQQAFVRQKLHKMSIIDTGGLPYETVFVKDIYYMITTNIDVSDGLANGAVGKLVHIERDDSGQVNFVWLEFSDSPKTGQKIRKKLLDMLRQII
ncbi:ATP-dependent DNA helicase [Trichonephila clavipes]|nr:ATP-dependent DNA helicase [Trichonephila clavipes]